MRHRIAVIGGSQCALSLARLLLARDDSHLLLTGLDGEPLRRVAAELDVEPRVDGPVTIATITAAEVVVVCDEEPAPAHELRVRCPNALLVLATPEPAGDGRLLQDQLRWPRQRVIGIDAAAAAGGAEERAAAGARIVDHVLADRGRTIEATVQTTAQGGPGSWSSVPVRIGAAGLQAVEPAPVRP